MLYRREATKSTAERNFNYGVLNYLYDAAADFSIDKINVLC